MKRSLTPEEIAEVVSSLRQLHAASKFQEFNELFEQVRVGHFFSFLQVYQAIIKDITSTHKV